MFFTKRQLEVLDFLRQFISKFRVAPTLEEMAGHFRVSKITIHEHLKTLEDKAGTLHAHASTRSGQLRAEMGSNQGEREAIASRLSVSVRKKYEQIFSKRGGIPVVEIRRGSCQGCNMTIPPQLCIEVRKSQDLHLCPSCHRILFWREETTVAAGAIEK